MVNVEKAKQKLAKVRPGPIDEECLTLQLAEAATAPRIIWTHLPLKLLHPDLLNTCKVSDLGEVLVKYKPYDHFFITDI